MNASETAREPVLTVVVGKDRYALPIADVESVRSVRRCDISDVPFDTSGRIRGLFADRGSVVPLARREGLLAASDADGGEALTVVLLRDKGRQVALAVDQAITAAAETAPLLTAHMLYTGEANHGDD